MLDSYLWLINYDSQASSDCHAYFVIQHNLCIKMTWINNSLSENCSSINFFSKYLNNRFSSIIELIDWIIPVNSFFYNPEKNLKNLNSLSWQTPTSNPWFRVERTWVSEFLSLDTVLDFHLVKSHVRAYVHVRQALMSAKMSEKWLTDSQTEHQMSLGPLV